MRGKIWLLAGGTLLAVPLAQAQFDYTTNNGTITITGYTGAGGAVIIPDAIPATTNGLPVTGIGASAFYSASTLTSVTIPGSVTTIGFQAFEQCYNLTSVSIGNNVVSIGSDAFAYCSALTSVTVPDNVLSLGESAFYSCSGLTSATLGNGLVTIETSAFQKCFNLASVSVGNNVATIGSGAFANCSSLASVFFQGNAPSGDPTIFHFDPLLTIYYLPGTAGWSSDIYGVSASVWTLAYPVILPPPASTGTSASQFGFTISWATNLSVVVEACANLDGPQWQPLQTNALNNGLAYFSDPQWTNYRSRFYRVRSQ